jgi:Mn2+/Fe2+ NRAMP family transporter
LFWIAVINGVVAVPVMAIMMGLASREAVMGQFKLGRVLKISGWLATGVMALAAVGVFATMPF